MRPGTGPAAAAPVAAQGGPADESPGWPGEADEAAFLAAARENGGEPAPAAPAPPEGGAEPAGSLPPLDELAGRVPPAVRAALDDLFRAKFSAVRRIPAEVLEAQTSK